MTVCNETTVVASGQTMSCYRELRHDGAHKGIDSKGRAFMWVGKKTGRK